MKLIEGPKASNYLETKFQRDKKEEPTNWVDISQEFQEDVFVGQVEGANSCKEKRIV